MYSKSVMKTRIPWKTYFRMLIQSSIDACRPLAENIIIVGGKNMLQSKCRIICKLDD